MRTSIEGRIIRVRGLFFIAGHLLELSQIQQTSFIRNVCVRSYREDTFARGFSKHHSMSLWGMGVGRFRNCRGLGVGRATKRGLVDTQPRICFSELIATWVVKGLVPFCPSAPLQLWPNKRNSETTTPSRPPRCLRSFLPHFELFTPVRKALVVTNGWTWAD